MPSLAAELLDLILSYLCPYPLAPGLDSNCLDKETARNLATCALVCKAWLPGSRRILFYRLCIRKVTVHTFATFFKKRNPGPKERLTYLSHVRELEFRDASAEDPWVFTVFTKKIAQYLPAPCALVLRYNFPPSGELMPKLDLTALTHLKVLSRDCAPDIGATIRLIAGCPKLEALALRNDRDRSRDLTEALTALKPAATLRHLDLKDQNLAPFLQWMQGPGPQSRSSGSTASSLLEYVGNLAPTLRRLELAFGCSNLPAPAIDAGFFTSHHRLEHLTIQTGHAQIETLLSKVELPASLLCLTLVFPLDVVVGFHQDTQLRSQISFPTSWSRALDGKIATSSLLEEVNLRYVSLRAEGVPDPVRMRWEEVCEGMEGVFPLCAARGIVRHDLVRASVVDWQEA
ncbi:hypothetical protein FB45DRAFT_1060556 [Roridomyces roridus]|uniref:F-box domain-containing protein n=1 Tax=Roridomyces roridus TaxID=1738132 RepID=A0AAD7FIM5_9AGAR|nr:hypothetical protein FB45DRAFT_1060556 [Roridomyces roridus]